MCWHRQCCSRKGNVDALGKTQRGKNLVEGVKWVSRWDAAVPAGNKQPIQLKHMDIT